jgi:hypothetical protein
MGDAVEEEEEEEAAAAALPPFDKSLWRCFLDVSDSSSAELDGWNMSPLSLFVSPPPVVVVVVVNNGAMLDAQSGVALRCVADDEENNEDGWTGQLYEANELLLLFCLLQTPVLRRFATCFSCLPIPPLTGTSTDGLRWSVAIVVVAFSSLGLGWTASGGDS